MHGCNQKQTRMWICPIESSYFKRKDVNKGKNTGSLCRSVSHLHRGMTTCSSPPHSTTHEVHFLCVHSFLAFRSCPSRKPLSVWLLQSTALDFPKLHVCFSRMQPPQGAVQPRRSAHPVSPSCHVLNNCCFTMYK